MKHVSTIERSKYRVWRLRDIERLLADELKLDRGDNPSREVLRHTKTRNTLMAIGGLATLSVSLYVVGPDTSPRSRVDDTRQSSAADESPRWLAGRQKVKSASATDEPPLTESACIDTKNPENFGGVVVVIKVDCETGTPVIDEVALTQK